MSRVLGVERYSGDDDAGALQRQEEALAGWISANGLKLAAWVEDETVSGGVNLDERPALGKWLKPPLLGEWDTQAANYRLDVKKKIKNARESLRQHRRWAGGHWPYGHRAVPNPDGDGWVLVEASQWRRNPGGVTKRSGLRASGKSVPVR